MREVPILVGCRDLPPASLRLLEKNGSPLKKNWGFRRKEEEHQASPSHICNPTSQRQRHIPSPGGLLLVSLSLKGGMGRRRRIQLCTEVCCMVHPTAIASLEGLNRVLEAGRHLTGSSRQEAKHPSQITQFWLVCDVTAPATNGLGGPCCVPRGTDPGYSGVQPHKSLLHHTAHGHSTPCWMGAGCCRNIRAETKQWAYPIPSYTKPGLIFVCPRRAVSRTRQQRSDSTAPSRTQKQTGFSAGANPGPEHSSSLQLRIHPPAAKPTGKSHLLLSPSFVGG